MASSDDDVEALLARSRDALQRAETTYSKVTSIGKIGSSKDNQLSESLKAFASLYESAREEVNAAIAVGSRSVGSDAGANGATGDAAGKAMEEAMALESAAEEQLRSARAANRRFQKKRAFVRDRGVEVWDRLVSVAKAVADADRLSDKSRRLCARGDAHKAGLCLEKAARRADRAHSAALATEQALAEVMDHMREGRTALHEAEAAIATGTLKAEQSRSLACATFELLGMEVPVQPRSIKGAAAAAAAAAAANSTSLQSARGSATAGASVGSSHGAILSADAAALNIAPMSVTVVDAVINHRKASSSKSSRSSKSSSKASKKSNAKSKLSASSSSSAPSSSSSSSATSHVEGKNHEEENSSEEFDQSRDGQRQLRPFASDFELLLSRDVWAKDEAKLQELTRQRSAVEDSLRQQQMHETYLEQQHGKRDSGPLSPASDSSSSSSFVVPPKSRPLEAMIGSLKQREQRQKDTVERHRAEHKKRFLLMLEGRRSQLPRPNDSSTGPRSTGGASSNSGSNQKPKQQRPLNRNQRAALATYYFQLAAELEDAELLGDAVEAYQLSLENHRIVMALDKERGSIASTSGAPASSTPSALKNSAAETHYNLAIVLDQLGRYDESIQASLAALSCRPEWAEAHYNLGQTFDACGNLEDAVACYGAAVRCRPDWEDARHNLAVAEHERDLARLQQPSSSSASSSSASSASSSASSLSPGAMVNLASATTPLHQSVMLPSSVSSPHVAQPPPQQSLFGLRVGHRTVSSGSGILDTRNNYKSDDFEDEGDMEDEWDVESACSKDSASSGQSGQSFWSAHSGASGKSHPSSHRSGGAGSGRSRGSHGQPLATVRSWRGGPSSLCSSEEDDKDSITTAEVASNDSSSHSISSQSTNKSDRRKKKQQKDGGCPPRLPHHKINGQNQQYRSQHEGAFTRDASKRPGFSGAGGLPHDAGNDEGATEAKCRLS